MFSSTLVPPRNPRTSMSSVYAASGHIVSALVRIARSSAKKLSASGGIGGRAGISGEGRTVSMVSPMAIVSREAATVEKTVAAHAEG